MEKEIIKIIIKVLIYLLTLIAGYLGLCLFSACTASTTVESRGYGRGIFFYTDTFQVEHGNDFKIKIK